MPEGPGERLEALRERMTWWKPTLFLGFVLWLGAISRAYRHGRSSSELAAAVLVAVVVVLMSWGLWVRTHPKRPGPGYTKEQVRFYVALTSWVVYIGLILLALTIAWR